MAGFRTHITTSTVLGIGYGLGAHFGYDVPVDQCLLATGLCGVSGMLPDIDSGSGVPLRESLAFGAAVVPMLLIDRFRHMGFTTDMMVLSGAMVYLFIRFGVGWFLRKYTVHRGMFHSIPAGLIFAELAYLICDCEQTEIRLFKAAAVLIGFFSHLLLDEFYSLYWHRGRLKRKKSFGTAFKLWGPKLWGNVSTFAKLAVLSYVILNEQEWSQHLHDHGAPHLADEQVRPVPPNIAGPTGAVPYTAGPGITPPDVYTPEEDPSMVRRVWLRQPR